MSTFSPHKPPVKPQTQLDWTGHPYSPEKGESYHGGAAPSKPHKEKVIKVKVPLSPERKEKLRQAMAYARACMAAKRNAARAKDLEGKG
jgi:hypothetical protein